MSDYKLAADILSQIECAANRVDQDGKMHEE